MEFSVVFSLKRSGSLLPADPRNSKKVPGRLSRPKDFLEQKNSALTFLVGEEFWSNRFRKAWDGALSRNILHLQFFCKTFEKLEILVIIFGPLNFFAVLSVKTDENCSSKIVYCDARNLLIFSNFTHAAGWNVISSKIGDPQRSLSVPKGFPATRSTFPNSSRFKL